MASEIKRYMHTCLAYNRCLLTKWWLYVNLAPTLVGTKTGKYVMGRKKRSYGGIWGASEYTEEGKKGQGSFTSLSGYGAGEVSKVWTNSLQCGFLLPDALLGPGGWVNMWPIRLPLKGSWAPAEQSPWVRGFVPAYNFSGSGLSRKHLETAGF